MPSRFADDDAALGPERPDEPADLPANTAPDLAPTPLPVNQVPGEEDLWGEPTVPTQRILTDIFKSGGKSPAEMQDLLNRNQTTMGWLEYWSRQGFLREVVKGREKQYVLSRRALLELELDVA